MKYHFKIHKEKKGFWAECLELKGCITQADSKSALATNMKEALDLYLNEPVHSSLTFPEPNKMLSGRDIVEVEVDPQIAFALRLKSLRNKNGMTQKDVAKKLGFKNLYSYQRLESSKTANPELTTIVKLKVVFPDLKMDEVV